LNNVINEAPARDVTSVRCPKSQPGSGFQPNIKLGFYH